MEQIAQEMKRFQAGVYTLKQAYSAPLHDIELLKDQASVLSTEAVSFERSKSDLLSSLANQALKCDNLDKSVCNLRELLEQAIGTINTAQDRLASVQHTSSPPVPPRLADVKADATRQYQRCLDKCNEQQAAFNKHKAWIISEAQALRKAHADFKAGVAGRRAKTLHTPEQIQDVVQEYLGEPEGHIKDKVISLSLRSLVAVMQRLLEAPADDKAEQADSGGTDLSGKLPSRSSLHDCAADVADDCCAFNGASTGSQRLNSHRVNINSDDLSPASRNARSTLSVQRGALGQARKAVANRLAKQTTPSPSPKKANKTMARHVSIDYSHVQPRVNSRSERASTRSLTPSFRSKPPSDSSSGPFGEDLTSQDAGATTSRGRWNRGLLGNGSQGQSGVAPGKRVSAPAFRTGFTATRRSSASRGRRDTAASPEAWQVHGGTTRVASNSRKPKLSRLSASSVRLTARAQPAAVGQREANKAAGQRGPANDFCDSLPFQVEFGDEEFRAVPCAPQLVTDTEASPEAPGGKLGPAVQPLAAATSSKDGSTPSSLTPLQMSSCGTGSEESVGCGSATDEGGSTGQAPRLGLSPLVDKASSNCSYQQGSGTSMDQLAGTPRVVKNESAVPPAMCSQSGSPTLPAVPTLPGLAPMSLNLAAVKGDLPSPGVSEGPLADGALESWLSQPQHDQDSMNTVSDGKQAPFDDADGLLSKGLLSSRDRLSLVTPRLYSWEATLEQLEQLSTTGSKI